ncbi:LysR family transcriptional regulator [Nocardia brevicatena]|uniref:LysR family transcriptional regulator n=1 Tax=Nocardia brevicatena TaxID=37327 RepID=UPI0002E684EC|nr:LysR substrate-binding domain-containing protein [Nocardia brevicatena]
MEIHQLRYLAAVVDEGSFTDAAARLHVSQSGVSTQVAKLERELGHRLLHRSGRSVRLTPVGEAVLPLAREALESLDAIAHTAVEFAEAVRGSVRLGMIMGCSLPGFLDAIAETARTHPGITVGLTEDYSPALQAQVLSRSLDLALIGFAGATEPGLDVTVVSDEPLTAVVPHGHRLDRASLLLSDLHEETALCLPRGTGIRTAYERSCLRSGTEPRVALEANSPQTLIGLVQRGAGVAVLTRSAGAAPGVRTVPFVDAPVHACLGIVRRPDQRSPAVRLLLTRLEKSLQRTADIR